VIKFIVKLKTTTITYSEAVVEAPSHSQAWDAAVQEHEDRVDETEYSKTVEVTEVEES
jgi:hypothetical protein